MNKKNAVFMIFNLLLCGAVIAQPLSQPSIALAQDTETNVPLVPTSEPSQEPAQGAKTEDLKKEQVPQQKALKAEKQEQEEVRKEEAMRKALRGTKTVTEYTLDPDKVEMVVALDSDHIGFRGRSHRMLMQLETDVLFAGRTALKYDLRFSEFLSVAAQAGISWTKLSLYSQFSDLLDRPSPRQFSLFGGLSTKFRMTEWFLRTSIFLEPSLLVGPMWQTYVDQKSVMWRVRPGAYVGWETVFDSGFTLGGKCGAEWPVDFGGDNPLPTYIEPMTSIAFGFAW